jgi:type II secretion system protein I
MASWSAGSGQVMMIHRRQDGFTMIEVLIAMALLTIVLLGLCGASVMAINGNSLSKMSTTATVIAKDKIESLKNISYNQITSGSDTPEANFTRRWTVTNNSPVTNTKTIAVTVSWIWQSLSHNVTLNTIFTR